MNDASGEHVGKYVREAQQAGATPADAKHEMCKETQRTHAHTDPTRWWFASSAFPMIAGTLGPVASAFSICALVRPWRQRWTPGTKITNAASIPDPSWLIIVNAIQLVVAIISNLFLLLNMARRIRFTIAMPVTIIGWYLSAICLVALLASAVRTLVFTEPGTEHVWSQAFWYGVFASLLYFVVATLLVVTAWGAHQGRYDKDFQLTASQRTLMLQTIMFLTYLLLGALVFSTIEGWSYLDAVYWADVTLFTVGFGDVSPKTSLGRGLLFPYALVGVISLGLVIGSIRSLVLERGRRMLHARMIEKKRRRLVKRLTDLGKDDVLTPIKRDGSELEGYDKGPSPPLRQNTGTSLTEIERREQEFKLMRRVQKAAAKRRRWLAMALSSSTTAVLWLLGAFIFQSCELPFQGWSYFDSVYFCFVGLTTIGYGDITPVSNSGRAFFVFWSLLALPTMTVLISNAGDTVIKSIRETTDQLGSITILPGDRGALKDVKAILRTMSCGVLFSEDDSIEEEPPGFLGEARVRRSSNASSGYGSDEEERENEKAQSDEALADEEKVLKGHHSPQRAADAGPSATNSEHVTRSKSKDTLRPRSSRSGTDTGSSPEGGAGPHTETRSTVPYRIDGDSAAVTTKPLERHASGSTTPAEPQLQYDIVLPPIPANRADYLVLLIDEIARVSQHMKMKPSKKYSFVEWAWYLRLIGEDEDNAEMHRRALPHVHAKSIRRTGSSSSASGKSFSFVKGRRSRSASRDPENRGEGSSEKDASNDAGESAEAVVDDLSTTSGSGKAAATQEQLSPHSGSWSWIGTRSPLMGRQDEAEWIHEKLVMKLAEELRAARQEDYMSRDGGHEG